MEGVGTLTGEDPAATELVHGLRRQLGVVGRAARTHVDRRAGELAGQLAPLAVLDPGHRVELRAVPVLVTDAGDRPDVVEERLRVADLGGEAELVGDVGGALAGVRDVDLVGHVVAELVEVRAAVGSLQRDVVGDQHDVVGLRRADERVDVGAVGNRVLADLRCFAVRRHVSAPRVGGAGCVEDAGDEVAVADDHLALADEEGERVGPVVLDVGHHGVRGTSLAGPSLAGERHAGRERHRTRRRAGTGRGDELPSAGVCHVVVPLTDSGTSGWRASPGTSERPLCRIGDRRGRAGRLGFLGAAPDTARVLTEGLR